MIIIFFLISARDCTWADWTTWSQCSKTCGDGTRTKTRTKLITEVGGGVCNGEPFESELCNLEGCKICFFVYINM